MLKTMWMMLCFLLVPSWALSFDSPTNAMRSTGLGDLDAATQDVWAEAQGDLDAAGELDDQVEENGLIDEVANGIVRVIESEHCSWYECGTITPPDEYMDRARNIAQATRTALLENGLSHPNYLWGSVGIIMQESRGNPCPFGPYSRQWAIDKNLVKAKHMIKWDRDDALRVMHAMKSGKVKRRGVDSGIGQTIWPHNSKIRMPDGTVRTATPEEMVTVDGGARTLAYHMQQNAQLGPQRPWAYWPGAMNVEYGEKIEWWVRRMRGPTLGPKARWQ